MYLTENKALFEGRLFSYCARCPDLSSFISRLLTLNFLPQLCDCRIVNLQFRKLSNFPHVVFAGTLRSYGIEDHGCLFIERNGGDKILSIIDRDVRLHFGIVVEADGQELKLETRSLALCQ